MTITYDKQVLIKRGNTASVSSYVGPLGELVLDTDTDRVYVHDGATAGGILVGDGTYGNANVAAYISTDATIVALVANAGVQSANIATLTANAAAQAGSIASLEANAAVQSGQISQVQTNITTANTNMKGYVDNSISANITAIINGAPGALDTLNELANALGNNASFSTTITNSLATLTSNAAVQAGLIADTNTAITTANLAMKGYVDSQSFYSNAKVASYLPTYNGNIKISNVTFSDLSVQRTAYTGQSWRTLLESNLQTKPNWLAYVPDGSKPTVDVNFGFDSGGMWFTGNANDQHAYPIRTNVSFYDTDATEIIATFDYDSIGDDHGIAIFNSATTQPFWRFGTDASRIAWQISTATPELRGQTTSSVAGAPVLEINNTYTVRMVYDPLAVSNQVTVELYQGTGIAGTLLDTRTINETLPAGAYEVGFDADQDNLSLKSYFTALTIRTLTNAVFNDIEVVNDLQIDGTVTGNLIPSANVTYDLGSPTARWRDLYLSGSTIYLGGATLSVSGGAIQSSLPIAANLTATNITVQGTRIEFASGGYIEEAEVFDGNANPLGYYAVALNSSDDGLISMNALDSNAVATSSVIVSNVSVQLNVANSTPGGNPLVWNFDNNGIVAFPGSGSIDGSDFDIDIAAGNDGASTYGTISLFTNSPNGPGTNALTFNSLGELNVSTVGANDGLIKWVGNSSGDGAGYTTMSMVPDTTREGTDQYIIIDPTGGEPGHIHIRAGGTQDASGADLYLGGELTAVRVSDTSGHVTIRTTNIGDPNITLDWSFQPDGNLYFPGIGNNRIGESEPGLVVSSDNSVVLQSNNAGTSKEWLFSSEGISGTLTLPGEGIIQSIDDTVALRSVNTSSGFANSIYLGSSGGLGFNDSAIGGNWLEIFRSGATPEITAPTGNLKITTVVTGVSSNTWTFNTNGSITFPDTTVQTTAWTGTVSYGNTIAIGYQTGATSQGSSAVAIGSTAGNNTQGIAAVALGEAAGRLSQGVESVAIGKTAGEQSQGAYAIAIGSATAYYQQGIGAVAIGTSAGALQQGDHAVAIGTGAGNGLQGNNSIILNATGNMLDQTTANTFTVAPIRNTTSSSGVLQYNNSTSEVTYANTVALASGTVEGFAIGYKEVPQIAAGNVTLALSDSGKHYYSSAATPTTLTIPSNANVAFPIGTAISIVNAGSGNIIIGKQTEASLYLAGNTTNTTRTLTSYGMATVLKTATDQWFISGSGLE